MKARVYVTLKPGILDPQGQAVNRTLEKMGYESVQGVRIGKYVEIELDHDNEAKAKEEVTRMCKELIANMVIEDYRIELGEAL